MLPRTGPARHSGAQRQHQGGDAVDLSDRRPQSHRHASRLRLPAQHRAAIRPSAWPNERGARMWSGELAVEPKLNAEVTTAFPARRRRSGSQARRLRHDRRAEGCRLRVTTASRRRNGSSFPISASRPTPRMTALTSLSTRWRAPIRAAASRCAWLARNNEVLAVRQTDRNGFIHFEAGLARGEGGAAPAAIVASREERLRVPEPEIACVRFVRSRRRRTAGSGWARCLRLYGARRLPHRRERLL